MLAAKDEAVLVECLGVDFEAGMVKATYRLCDPDRSTEGFFQVQRSVDGMSTVIFGLSRWVLLTAVLAVLVGAVPVWAASEVSFAWLRVELLPEFDRIEPLVLISGSLDPNVELPARLTLTIPAAAGSPHAVAVRNAEGRLLVAPHGEQRLGDNTAVTFSAAYPDIWLEYYDPALVVSGQARTYHFRWTTEYAARQTTVIMQRPLGARDFKTEPLSVPAGEGRDGSSYYSAELGARGAGQAIEVTLEYTKERDTLTAPAPAVRTSPPGATATPSPSPRTSDLSSGLMATFAVSALLFVGAAIWYVRGSRSTRDSDAAPTKARNQKAERSGGLCSACGQRVEPEDKFCTKCGARLKN